MPEARFLKPGYCMHIIVDGYNLIRQSDILRLHERQGLEAGRKALVHLLAGYRRSRGHRITVVFDGWLGGPPQEERDREALEDRRQRERTVCLDRRAGEDVAVGAFATISSNSFSMGVCGSSFPADA